MSSPFLQDFLAQTPRELTAPCLALELRETIRRWFEINAHGVQDQERILGALAAVMVHQIMQDPDEKMRMDTADRALAAVLCAIKRENLRRALGGIQVKLVKQ